MLKHSYIHIPKTGGTAIKYALLAEGASSKIPISIAAAGHNQRLSGMNENTCFVIRDPWQRFCSGFWERVTVNDRKAKSKSEYSDLRDFGYRDLDPVELQILSECKTPNEFVSYIRDGKPILRHQPGLFELTGSITHWLGDLEDYKKHEHKISLVFDISSMNKIMKEIYDIDIPQDPFQQRSRKLFDLEQSYDISPENLSWFINKYRHKDYELIDYIKGQEYFLS